MNWVPKIHKSQTFTLTFLLLDLELLVLLHHIQFQHHPTRIFASDQKYTYNIKINTLGLIGGERNKRKGR